MVLKGRRRAERDRAVTAAAVAVKRRRGCGARRTARVTDMAMIAVGEEEMAGEGRIATQKSTMPGKEMTSLFHESGQWKNQNPSSSKSS